MRDVGVIRSITDLQVFERDDHFFGGVASASIGELGWTETSSAAGTNAAQAGGLDHPGVIRLVTGAVSTNNKRLHLGLTASEASFTPANFDRFRWVVRISTITTLTVRLGLMQDVSAAAGGTAGAYFEFDPATSGTWGFVTRQASAQTRNVLTTVVAGNWYQLEAQRQPSGTWTWAVNGTAGTPNAANLPTTACAFGALCQTGAAAARNLDLDYCYVRSVLGQLWT